MTPVWCVFVLASFCGTAADYARDYLMVSTQMNWTEARSYCRKHYTDLATITSDKVIQQLGDIGGNVIYYSFFWIGFYRAAPGSNTFLWSDNEPMVYTGWAPNEPDNFRGTENCGVLYFGGWNDFDCSVMLPSICYRNLILVMELKTWDEALQYCRKTYTDLYSPMSDTRVRLDQQDNIKPQTTQVWMGLYFLDGKWFWLNGQSVQGMGSLASCPARNYNCGAQNSGTGVWESGDCNEKLNFLCI